MRAKERNMFCKKNGGYIAIIIGVLIALYGANKSHAEGFDDLAINTHTASVLIQTNTGK